MNPRRELFLMRSPKSWLFKHLSSWFRFVSDLKM
jgi:hypothetical protein